MIIPVPKLICTISESNPCVPVRTKKSLASFFKDSKFLTYRLSHDFLNRTFILFDLVSQSLVYCRLVSLTFALSLISEPLQDIRIYIDRDSGLAFLGYDRASLAFRRALRAGDCGVISNFAPRYIQASESLGEGRAHFTKKRRQGKPV